MRLHHHTIASTLISAGLYSLTGSLPLAASSFAMGVFIDLDHLGDYWREHPGSCNIRHFFATCHEYGLRQVYLVLHSLELLPFLALALYLIRGDVMLGLFIGFAQHMALDHYYNRTHGPSYLFIYRWQHGFLNAHVFKGKGE